MKKNVKADCRTDKSKLALIIEQLKESEARYRGIFKTSRDTIMTLDPPSWNFTSANPVTLRMFKAKNQAEFLSYPPWKLSPKFQPDGSLSTKKAKKMIRLAMKNGSSLFLWMHKRINGEKFLAEVFLSRISFDRKTFLQAIVRDITKENEMVVGLQGFEKIFNNSQDGILLVDVKSKKIELGNRSFCKMLGYSLPEIKKLSIFDIHPKKDLPFVLKKFVEMQKKKYIAQNIPVKRKDGSIFYSNITSSIIDIDGKKLALGMFRDITEIRQAQLAILESENNFRSIYEQSPVAIFIVSLDGHFLKSNKAATKMMHFSGSELKKLTFADITHPDEVKRDLSKIKEMVAKNILHYAVSKRYVRKDGKIIYAQTHVTLIKDKNNHPLYFLTFVEDITNHQQWIEKLEKSEERYSTLIEGSNDAVVVIRDGVIEYANPAVKNIIGLEPKNVVGRMMTDFIAPDYRKMVFDNHKNRLKGKEVINRYELAVVNASGKIISVEANNSLITFNGRPAAMSILRDISRHKEIDRIKSEFISVASHQLRTPLTGIKWFGQLLLGQKVGRLSDKQIDYVQQIYNSNERMIRLINDLIDVSHIETGQKFTIERKRHNIVALIGGVIKDQKINFSKNNVVIELDRSWPKKLFFNFDQDKIYQVFSNLINNSIKYSESNKKIIIGFKRLDNQVMFFVRDFGLGIPAEQQRRIFEKFFRADNTSVVFTEGTGLGLYITKGIIEAHGGKIWFESEQNKGSTFYFTLPFGGRK